MAQRRKKAGHRRKAQGYTEPHRSCVGCRAVVPQKTLLRFFRSVDGRVGVDHFGQARTQGRGAYTCAQLSCVTTAIKRGAFSRAFAKAVDFSDDTLTSDALAHPFFHNSSGRDLHPMSVNVGSLGRKNTLGVPHG